VKKAKIMGNKTTVVGVFDRMPVEEEEYILEGDFVKDPKFGLQFKFSSFKRKDFESPYGIINYLSSDLFPGVGLKAATQVVEALGIEALAKIKKDPNCLDKIDISLKQKTVIKTGVINDDTAQNAIIFLLNHGVTIDMANRIINALEGLNVKDIVSENPYILIDKVERFGFKKADALASSIGIPKTAICRLKALLCYTLKEVLYSSGNSYISKSELYISINKLTGDELEKGKFQDVLNMLEQEKRIFIDQNQNIFDYANYLAEVDLAIELSSLLKNERNGEDAPFLVHLSDNLYTTSKEEIK
jgi:exodeoxyribonuclease V alpha subunit